MGSNPTLAHLRQLGEFESHFIHSKVPSHKYPKGRMVIMSPLSREFKKRLYAQCVAQQHQALGEQPEKWVEHGS